MGMWVNTQMLWANGGVTAPVPTEHTNGTEYSSLAAISTETSWVGPMVPSSSLCTGYNVLPDKAPMFLTWASDLESWGLQNELTGLQATVDVPKRRRGSTRATLSLLKGPTEATHLPTIGGHRLKHSYFGLELHQLNRQWPWWQLKEEKYLLAARSVLYSWKYKGNELALQKHSFLVPCD